MNDEVPDDLGLQNRECPATSLFTSPPIITEDPSSPDNLIIIAFFSISAQISVKIERPDGVAMGARS